MHLSSNELLLCFSIHCNPNDQIFLGIFLLLQEEAVQHTVGASEEVSDLPESPEEHHPESRAGNQR